MEDKEVGEIWRWVNSSVPDDADIAIDVQCKIEKLIIKLVKDRMKWHQNLGFPGLKCALHDFGINVKDWYC